MDLEVAWMIRSITIHSICLWGGLMSEDGESYEPLIMSANISLDGRRTKYSEISEVDPETALLGVSKERFLKNDLQAEFALDDREYNGLIAALNGLIDPSS